MIMSGLILLFSISLIIWLTPKRRSIWLAILVYFIGALISVFLVGFRLMQSMSEQGEGDPELVAGAIAESIIGEGIASIVFIPVLIGLYFIVKRLKLKKQKIHR